MSIHLPSQCGIIIRKSAPTIEAVIALRQRTRHFPRNEDEHLAGFWLAGSSGEADDDCQELAKTYGLREGVDFVQTVSSDGVQGPMPEWLQENQEPVNTFSVPGTAGPARSEPRLTWSQEIAIQRRANRLAKLESRRAGDAAALRRWPELARGDVTALLGECWALVQFVENSRGGGPARSWVEQVFPTKTWHISVHHGYTNELRDYLTAYYQANGSPQALARVRRRAGEYVAGLEAGALKGTVDLDCFDAWRRTHFTQDRAAYES
jgi:hypothetical protein